MPTLHLRRILAPLPAVVTEFSGIKPCDPQTQLEMLSSTPTFWFLLGCRDHLPLQPPAPPPDLEADHVNALLRCDLVHARPHGIEQQHFWQRCLDALLCAIKPALKSDRNWVRNFTGEGGGIGSLNCLADEPCGTTDLEPVAMLQWLSESV